MGKKKVQELDPALLKRRFWQMLTDKDIAKWHGIDENTLHDNFSDQIDKKRIEAKLNIFDNLFDLAKEGNTAVSIFLGKVFAQMREDQQAQMGPQEINIKLQVVKDE